MDGDSDLSKKKVVFVVVFLYERFHRPEMSQTKAEISLPYQLEVDFS